MVQFNASSGKWTSLFVLLFALLSLITPAGKHELSSPVNQSEAIEAFILD